MNEWLFLILSSFATYRIAHLIAKEEGPFELFTLLRTAIFEKFGNGWVNEGINCVLCISFWLSIVPAIVAVLLFNEQLWVVLLWWFGIAGISTAIYKVTE